MLVRIRRITPSKTTAWKYVEWETLPSSLSEIYLRLETPNREIMAEAGDGEGITEMQIFEMVDSRKFNI